MNPYVDILKKYVAAHPLKYRYKDVTTLADMLFCCYSDYVSVDNQQIRSLFLKLDASTSRLTLAESDSICNLTGDLCYEYQRSAFLAGLRVGAELTLELTQLEP